MTELLTASETARATASRVRRDAPTASANSVTAWRMAVSDPGTASQVLVHGVCACIAVRNHDIAFVIAGPPVRSGAGLDLLALAVAPARGLVRGLVGDEPEAEVEKRLDGLRGQQVEQRARAADQRRDIARPADDRLQEQVARLARRQRGD